jgi:single-strand DNA-binding protein
MPKDLNLVQIIGRLGKDPETRQMPQGGTRTSFSVASGRRWRTADGEDRDDTQWFNIVANNEIGERCSRELRKGTRVYIEGRLQTRSWDDKDTGQKRYITEIIPTDMIMLDDRREMGSRSYEDDDAGYDAPTPSQPRSFAARASSARATPAETAVAEIDEDDLPF